MGPRLTFELDRVIRLARKPQKTCFFVILLVGRQIVHIGQTNYIQIGK